MASKTTHENTKPENTNEISVSFPEDKLRALEFYLKDHGLTPQKELENYLSTMFLRAVPEEVRRFSFPDSEQMEDNALFAGAGSKREAKTSRTPEQKAALNEKRRLERQAGKENPITPEVAPAAQEPAEPEMSQTM